MKNKNINIMKIKEKQEKSCINYRRNIKKRGKTIIKMNKRSKKN